MPQTNRAASKVRPHKEDVIYWTSKRALGTRQNKSTPGKLLSFENISGKGLYVKMVMFVRMEFRVDLMDSAFGVASQAPCKAEEQCSS